MYTLHGMLTLHSNILSDIRIAKEAGFDGLELHTEKLWRYLQAGGTAEQLKAHADQHGISFTAIDIIGNVEACSRKGQAHLALEARQLSEFAAAINCPIIQLNAFCDLDGLSLEQNLNTTAENIRTICDIGSEYDIRFQYEGAAWTPLYKLQDHLQLIQRVERDNFGLVIDFWHYWASRGACPEELSQLEKKHIFGVHVCDGLRPELNATGQIQTWEDESVYRKFLPGDGELPVKLWLEAVKTAGYQGSYSGEIINPWLWEQDHLELACNMKKALTNLLEGI